MTKIPRLPNRKWAKGEGDYLFDGVSRSNSGHDGVNYRQVGFVTGDIAAHLGHETNYAYRPDEGRLASHIGPYSEQKLM